MMVMMVAVMMMMLMMTHFIGSCSMMIMCYSIRERVELVIRLVCDPRDERLISGGKDFDLEGGGERREERRNRKKERERKQERKEGK